jgi:hypothetical protein
MIPVPLRLISLRAKTAIGALCLRRYCEELGESHREIDEFCDYLLKLPKAEDIMEWDESGGHLAQDGLGSPIPDTITHIPKINEITCNIREITASQMCCAYNPKEPVAFVKRAAELCGVDLQRDVDLKLFMKGSSLRSEWADPISNDLFNLWLSEGISRKEQGRTSRS